MIEEVLTQVVTMAVGGIATGTAWIVRAVLKCQRDIDAAHIKLRGIYDSGLLDQDRIGSGSQGAKRDIHLEGGNSCPKCLGKDDGEQPG